MIGDAESAISSIWSGSSLLRDGSSISLGAGASTKTPRGQISGTSELLRRFRVVISNTTSESGL